MEKLISDFLVPLTITSFAYVMSFIVTFVIISPIQDVVFQGFGGFASLLFLPHGVRIIVAWLYGWRSILFLAPGALLTHFYLFGLQGLSMASLLGAFSGIFCAALSFWALAFFRLDFRLTRNRLTSWRDLLLAGSFASVLNVIGTAVFLGHDTVTAAAYFIGDIGGFLVLLVATLFVFRAVRRATD